MIPALSSCNSSRERGGGRETHTDIQRERERGGRDGGTLIDKKQVTEERGGKGRGKGVKREGEQSESESERDCEDSGV